MDVSFYCKERICDIAIDGLQSRDETAMLVDKTIANFSIVMSSNMAAMTSSENHLLTQMIPVLKGEAGIVEWVGC